MKIKGNKTEIKKDVKLAQTDENKAKIIRTAFTGITNYMFAEDRSNLLGNLKIATDKLDNVRNQQLANYLPWLVDIINQRS